MRSATQKWETVRTERRQVLSLPRAYYPARRNRPSYRGILGPNKARRTAKSTRNRGRDPNSLIWQGGRDRKGGGGAQEAEERARIAREDEREGYTEETEQNIFIKSQSSNWNCVTEELEPRTGAFRLELRTTGLLSRTICLCKKRKVGSGL